MIKRSLWPNKPCLMGLVSRLSPSNVSMKPTDDLIHFLTNHRPMTVGCGSGGVLSYTQDKWSVEIPSIRPQEQFVRQYFPSMAERNEPICLSCGKVLIISCVDVYAFRFPVSKYYMIVTLHTVAYREVHGNYTNITA